MIRPVILTEAQLRAAVAVAEAGRARNETMRHVGRLGCDIMARPEFAHVEEWGDRYDAAKPSMHASEEWRAADADFKAAEVAFSEALQMWVELRPSTHYEVRAGETLARIVAEKTDGGTESAARGGLLSEVLREFEGREVRDGAR